MSYLNYKKILKIFEKLEINVIDINKELFLNLKNKKACSFESLVIIMKKDII